MKVLSRYGKRASSGHKADADASSPGKTIIKIHDCPGMTREYTEIVDSFNRFASKYDGRFEISQSSSYGMTSDGITIDVLPEGTHYTHVRPNDSEHLFGSIRSGRTATRFLHTQKTGNDLIVFSRKDDIPFNRMQERVSTFLSGEIDPSSVEDYSGFGGFGTARKVTAKDLPGFIAGLKRFSGEHDESTSLIDDMVNLSRKKSDFMNKFIVCNSAGNEPRSCIDHYLVYNNPMNVIEGMLISAMISGADKGIICVRNDNDIVKRITSCVEQAYSFGMIGECSIRGESSFDIEIVKIPNSIRDNDVISAIEGRFDNDNKKPELWGCPAAICSPVALSKLPYLAKESLNGLPVRKDKKDKSGTKVITILGDLDCTGIAEVNNDMTIKDIIFSMCEGMRHGKEFGAVLARSDAYLFLEKNSLNRKIGSIIAGGCGQLFVFEKSREKDIAEARSISKAFGGR